MSAAANRDPLVVLKFGSSVLRDGDDLPRAVHAIHRHLREGRRVLAVVSALGPTTDRLLERANRLTERPGPRDLARLLAGGERESGALLALALERAGIRAEVLEPTDGCVRARGAVLDAGDPVIDRGAFERAFAQASVCVLPGFYARHDDTGGVCLLGRGGSDLTAVACGHALGAERCVLLKDVDGLYERDPADTLETVARPRRFTTVTFADAAALDGRILQAKAVAWAAARGACFEVGDDGAVAPTLVGAAATTLAPSAPDRARLRVALAGLGTVGSGVFERLRRLDLELVGVLVRDRARPREIDASPAALAPLLTDDADDLFECPFDALIELVGGAEVGGALARRALADGRHVITANKAWLAADASAASFAAEHGVHLLDSAAVGGNVPALERVRALVDTGRPVASIAGVLNGTVGFVLDQLEVGASLEVAVARAQERGLAEADPSLDLDGHDAAHKIELLARAAGAERVRFETIEGVDAATAERARDAASRGRRCAQVARVDLVTDADGARVGVARVRLLELDATHPLGVPRGEDNAVSIGTEDGEQIVLTGRGAGRWPTTEAVIGDLLELVRRGARARGLGRARDGRREG